MENIDQLRQSKSEHALLVLSRLKQALEALENMDDEQVLYLNGATEEVKLFCEETKRKVVKKQYDL